MDVPTLSTFLSPKLTVASVWDTGETGDIKSQEFNLIPNSLPIHIKVSLQLTSLLTRS